jgi:hypothetical protein
VRDSMKRVSTVSGHISIERYLDGPGEAITAWVDWSGDSGDYVDVSLDESTHCLHSVFLSIKNFLTTDAEEIFKDAGFSEKAKLFAKEFIQEAQALLSYQRFLW